MTTPATDPYSAHSPTADMPTVQIPEIDRPTDEIPASDQRERRSMVDDGVDVPEAAESVIETEGSAAHVASSHDRPTAIASWCFREHEEPHRVQVSQLRELVTHDPNFIWVALAHYDPEDLRAIADQLDLNRVSLHMALSSWQRPRLEVYKEQYFVTATIARVDSQAYRIHASELDLFVGQNYLVTASKLPLPFAEHILARASRNPELVRLDSSYMLYIILDELLEHYEHLNEHMQGEIEKMEQRALADTSESFLQDLINLKRFTFALAQLAEQHRQIFEAFLRPDFQFISGNDVDVYFRDLEARLSRLLANLASGREAVSGAFDIYVSHVTFRTNQVIKVLTMVSTILLPITVVVAFFGTSFHSLGFLYSAGGFALMLGCIVLISASILATFHRQGWL